MRTYRFQTTWSPMDDDDLQNNFVRMRKKYWIKRGLWIPENVKTVFRHIRDTTVWQNHPCGQLDTLRRGYKIVVSPPLAFIYCVAHITLLHEMAHLYRIANFNDHSHGDGFKKEIDRLYAADAFRKLI